MAISKKKKRTVAAVATAAVLLLGGTFAWQSISQTALNEASDVVNPGGRLHDDFNGTNKDVYVENFAEDDIFARVKLDEYFEIVMNQGVEELETTDVITTGAEKNDQKTWPTHKFGEANATDDFWDWQTGGQTVFMPTFNLNKDSLKADVNGTYSAEEGSITDRDGSQYEGYEEYTVGQTLDGTETYDADSNTEDEGNVKEVGATHTAQETLGATLMSMEEWMTTYNSAPGEYWVYDTDGWVYWAQAIKPGTATGLLLDGIELVQVMDDSWYYGINVVGQFITADDLGRGQGTGFYQDGETVSADALALLEKIGVDTASKVSDAGSLKTALESGGNIEINGTIDSPNAEPVANIKVDLLMTEGGTVNGGTINSSAADAYATLFINNEINWPKDGDGASEATINGTKVISNDNYGIYIQAINKPVTLNDVTVTGENGGILAEHKGDTVTLNNVKVDAKSKHDTDWVNTAIGAANGANVVIDGGNYVGKYAAYVYSSGGTITINSGNFEGELRTDKGSIVINGGTFDHDPTAFVDINAYTVSNNEDGTWTVKQK